MVKLTVKVKINVHYFGNNDWSEILDISNIYVQSITILY